MQWKNTDSLPTKDVTMQKSVGKVKAGISLDSEGILAPDFSAIRTPTTGSYYAEIVKFYVKPLHRKVK